MKRFVYTVILISALISAKAEEKSITMKYVYATDSGKSKINPKDALKNVRLVSDDGVTFRVDTEQKLISVDFNSGDETEVFDITEVMESNSGKDNIYLCKGSGGEVCICENKKGGFVIILYKKNGVVYLLSDKDKDKITEKK